MAGAGEAITSQMLTVCEYDCVCAGGALVESRGGEVWLVDRIFYVYLNLNLNSNVKASVLFHTQMFIFRHPKMP